MKPKSVPVISHFSVEHHKVRLNSKSVHVISHFSFVDVTVWGKQQQHVSRKGDAYRKMCGNGEDSGICEIVNLEVLYTF
ncbi:hypothetical protein DPMN_113486 [Dreissena polymorpha]|uniref:Uncharacterized protein n=1 Tax=Dreissena polymorpha TaxID=45954 RepID=A0A9D4QQV9_DREPO|nr:hypothetical protein DPMN_113486 [Dreissena polymorpha]